MENMATIKKETDIVQFLTALKKCDAEKLKKIEFKEENYAYPPGKPSFMLRKLSKTQVEIRKVIDDYQEKLIIPEKLDDKEVIGIGQEACRGKIKLKELQFASKIEYIGNGAFADCINLKTVVLNSELEKLGNFHLEADGHEEQYVGAFENCAIENIDLPEALVSIGENTFSGCKELKRISIPEKINTIKAGCFYQCQKLENISLPDNIESIEDGAFYECESLKEFSIPQKLEAIGDFVFQWCTRLSKVQTNIAIKKIGISAFRGCDSLLEITLPSGVNNLHRHTFDIFSGNKIKINCHKDSYAWKYAKENNLKISEI